MKPEVAEGLGDAHAKLLEIDCLLGCIYHTDLDEALEVGRIDTTGIQMILESIRTAISDANNKIELALLQIRK